MNQCTQGIWPLRSVLLVLAVLWNPFPGRAEGSRTDRAVRTRALAYYYYSLAQQAQREGDYRESAKWLQQVLQSDPATPSVRRELAEVYLLLGEEERAEETLRSALEVEPENPEIHRLLADSFLRRMGQGNPSEYVDRAIQELKTAIRLDERDSESILRLGSLYLNLGRTQEAIRLLEGFQERHSGFLEVNLLLAKALLQVRETERAEDLLRGNLRLDPAHLETVDVLAGLCEVQERYGEAISLYRDLVEHYPGNQYVLARLGYLNLVAKRYREAARYLDRARQLAPFNQSILINLAQAYEETGDLPAARDVYQNLRGLAPGNRGITFHLARLEGSLGNPGEALRLYNELVADLEAGGMEADEEAESATISYLQIGRLHLRWRHPEEAVEAFRKALRISGGNRKDVHLFLVRAYLESGRLGLAGKTLERGERRFPDDISFAILRGEVLLRQGRTDEALRRLRRLWQVPGADRDTCLRLADLFLAEKQYTEAESLLSKALSLYPMDDMVYFQMGALREREGSLEEAETHFRKALGVNPRNALVLNYLGYMLVEKGVRLEESLGYIRKAVNLDRYNPAYLDSLGWAYFKLDRLDQAKKNLEAASRLSGGDPVIEDHLGDLYLRLGLLEEAIAAWERALRSGSEEPRAIQEKIRKASGTLEGRR